MTPNYQPHPLADIFPLMAGDEFAALRQDIAEHGLREPIWTLDGLILDGRNRWRACQELGLTPELREFNGDSPAQFVMSANLHRRHLNAGQKAVIAVKFEPFFAAEAKERQRQAGRFAGRDAEGNPIVQVVEKFPQPEKPEKPQKQPQKARDQAAKATGTNPHYVSDAKKIVQEHPELADEILEGKTTIQQAKRKVKETKREEKRQENREKIAAAGSVESLQVLGAKFPAIVIDPPWDWGDEGDEDQFGRARPDYGTMGIDQLLALPVADLSMDDCHLYLWITNRSLPKGFGLLERWGFRYITCLTWVKPYFGMGNYFRGQTEHVLFGVRGSLPLKRKDIGTTFAAPRGPGGHSSKPSEFLDLVESCSPGPYLEMFSRSERPGWTTWGQGGLTGGA